MAGRSLGRANRLLLRTYVVLGVCIVLTLVVGFLVSLSLPGWVWIGGSALLVILAGALTRRRVKLSSVDGTLEMRGSRYAELEALTKLFLQRHQGEFREASSGLVVPVAYSDPGVARASQAQAGAEEGSSSEKAAPEKKWLRKHIAENKDLYEFGTLLLPFVTAAGGAIAWIIAKLAN